MRAVACFVFVSPKSIYYIAQSSSKSRKPVYAVFTTFNPRNKKYRSCSKVDFQSFYIQSASSYSWTFPTTPRKSISHSIILNTVRWHSSHSFVRVSIRSTCLSSSLSWVLDRSRAPDMPSGFGKRTLEGCRMMDE